MVRTYTDEELIKGCVANKRRAQEALYRAHFPVMMRMIMRYTRDEEKAMTICNDGFLKVFKNIGSFRHKGSFQGWIRRIVYHAMSDHFRKESKYIQFMVFDEFERKEKESILPELYFEDLLLLVDRLPDASREVFKLYAIEGFNHREIGENLKISDNTSKWHLSNARQKLKEMIAQQNKSHVGRKG